MKTMPSLLSGYTLITRNHVVHPQACNKEHTEFFCTGNWLAVCVAQYPKSLPKQDHNSLKKSNHISPTPSGSSPKTLQINFPNDLVFLMLACTKAFQSRCSGTQERSRRTQLAFKYSLSIFLTSGNRDVNGEQISVTTFSGVKEHLMCSSAAAFSSAMSSPAMNDINIVSTNVKRNEKTYGDKACTRSSHLTWVHYHLRSQVQARRRVRQTSLRLPRLARRTIGGADLVASPSLCSGSNSGSDRNWRRVSSNWREG